MRDNSVVDCRLIATGRQARLWLVELARAFDDAIDAGVPVDRIVERTGVSRDTLTEVMSRLAVSV